MTKDDYYTWCMELLKENKKLKKEIKKLKPKKKRNN